jgi:hypothetical protein
MAWSVTMIGMVMRNCQGTKVLMSDRRRSENRPEMLMGFLCKPRMTSE